jgi:carboxylate-amine ligase
MKFDAGVLAGLKLALSGGRAVLRSAEPSRLGSAEYSFGIEEEYFLADAETLEVSQQTPTAFFEAVNWFTGGQAMREMLQAQLEVVTNIHVDIADAREELKFLRREAANVASQFGLAIMACGTHPTARWQQSQLSPKARYHEMIEDLRGVGERNMLCGMHVHVQLKEESNRFRVMCGMIPYIPLFIALSASSPFWNGRATGLAGYRLAAYDELPRTGLPELFTTEAEYRSYVDALTCSGVMPDDSYVWWAMRPSSRHPTLELRAPDSCTRLEDAIAIASLYRTLARHLDRNPNCANELTNVDRAIAAENKWRAQRYGRSCDFASRNGPVPIARQLEELIETLSLDAEALSCSAEIKHCMKILETGTSADGQLGAARNGGLHAAKEWIAQHTVRGLSEQSRRSLPAGTFIAPDSRAFQ